MDKNNRLDPEEWVERLLTLGFKGKTGNPEADARKLFKQFMKATRFLGERCSAISNDLFFSR